MSLVSASEISDDEITTGNDYNNKENLNIKTDATSFLNLDCDCGTFTDFYNDLINSKNKIKLFIPTTDLKKCKHNENLLP